MAMLAFRQIGSFLIGACCASLVACQAIVGDFTESAGDGAAGDDGPPPDTGADASDATTTSDASGDGMTSTPGSDAPAESGDATTSDAGLDARPTDATFDAIDAPLDMGTPDANPTSGADADAGPSVTVVPLGGACNATTSLCTTGNCVNGVCCLTASCAAADACHVDGACTAGTGVCTHPNAADNAPCNDGNACTQTDACQSGACIGGNPIQCNPIDVCHAQGTCNPSNGQCTAPPAAGANCANGQPCLAWYPDCDGDAFGNAAAIVVCSTTSPGVPPCGTGTYVQSATDCCDTDSRAHPGQTAFFTGVDGGTTDTCGSWDYDCSGAVEMQYTNLPNTCLDLPCSTFTSASTQCSTPAQCNGYLDPNPPCGSLMHEEVYVCIPGAVGAPCSTESFGNPAPDSAGFPVVVTQGCH
jgi:hypothetical protein